MPTLPGVATLPPAPRFSGLAIAALVLGVVGLVFSVLFFPLGLLLGLSGLVLGIVALCGKKPGKGVAVAATVCSVVVLLLSVVIGLTVGSLLVSRFADGVADGFAAAKAAAENEERVSVQSERVANNGKQIVMAITSAYIDRAANMRGEVWPNKGKSGPTRRGGTTPTNISPG